VVKSHGREHGRKKAWEEPGQVSGKKKTAREPLMMCRKRRDDVETAGSRYCGTSFGDACLRTKAASGIVNVRSYVRFNFQFNPMHLSQRGNTLAQAEKTGYLPGQNDHPA
jgi:hypothetical protein